MLANLHKRLLSRGVRLRRWDVWIACVALCNPRSYCSSRDKKYPSSSQNIGSLTTISSEQIWKEKTCEDLEQINHLAKMLLFLGFCRTWTKRYLITSQSDKSQKKTFRVGGPQSPFSISSSFILSFVLLSFFLNTKMRCYCQWRLF